MTRLPGDPSLAGKLRFAIGRRLPAENRDWVYHELTDVGWRWRTIGRHLILVLPIALVFALLPGPSYLHWMMPTLLLLPSVLVTASYADDIRASRLRQHGLPVPDDPDLGRPPDAA